jgi:hypothetical protein
MNKPVVGQIAELSFRNEGQNANWEYVVVEHIFDDRIQFVKESGGRYMHILNDDENDIVDNQPTKSDLNFLYKNGEPVIAKKKLFGGYKFK